KVAWTLTPDCALDAARTSRCFGPASGDTWFLDPEHRSRDNSSGPCAPRSLLMKRRALRFSAHVTSADTGPPGAAGARGRAWPGCTLVGLLRTLGASGSARPARARPGGAWELR